MSRLIKLVLNSCLVLLMLLATSVALPSSVSAQTKPWTGVCVHTATDALGNTVDVPTIQGFQCLVGNVLMVAISGIGLVGFVIMLVGAFRYLTSGGNSKATETARNTLTFAVVGLVVALSSFFIINIISNFTGITVLQTFTIPTDVSTNGATSRSR